MRVGVARALAPIRPTLGFWGAKFTKMGDFLPWTPMNRRAKFDAAIALSSAEKSVTVQTHTNTQTVIHVSTSCLSAGVELLITNKLKCKQNLRGAPLLLTPVQRRTRSRPFEHWSLEPTEPNTSYRRAASTTDHSSP